MFDRNVIEDGYDMTQKLKFGGLPVIGWWIACRFLIGQSYSSVRD